jgi:hypothetical protein
VQRPKAICQHSLEQVDCSPFANTLWRVAKGSVAAVECRIDATVGAAISQSTKEATGIGTRMPIMLYQCLRSS